MINKKQTFEEIISTAYDKGEFEVPEVELVDDFDVSDIEHPGQTGGSTVVRRSLGDAAITEILSNSGNTTVLNDGDGEIIHQEMPDGNNLVIEKSDGETTSRAITPHGTFESPEDYIPRALEIKLPETEQQIKKWRDSK
jgi:hypothetical protein